MRLSSPAGHSIKIVRLRREKSRSWSTGTPQQFVKGPGRNSGAGAGGEEPSPPRTGLGRVVNMISTRPAKNRADDKERQIGRKKQQRSRQHHQPSRV
ncbi:hypothetical protein Nepgr_006160 [Nepenthes gracilis]|uniref:Uncharacterized protein n=1 Tax=Nepenthes gracilis TaxID=150966 RepID=A0AAD3XHB7_NEPGR|nr:hypothetical protein Nepgr_006160 [Nepenthes gracilis]